MSTTHGQPGLSSDQRSTIRSTILSTRHTLEDELRRQLEKYGIYEDKRLPLENLTHLSVEEIETRRTLNAAIERELESTEGDLERSITNYVREATKTHLNRFVALKTIEVRGLVEETITERPEYGNRSYMHHTVAEIAGELTNAPDDGFGAVLALAYQEIGAEIRMIFEESDHTTINLDSQVVEEILDELDEIDDKIWERDEALGWIYQYFGEEERSEINSRVSEDNYKLTGTDIATRTQQFTPRYIVEWMVDNSVGRLWWEMTDGSTNIVSEESCRYFVPNQAEPVVRERKPVDEITILDPACGSGHMLLYAFDILYEIYLEAGEIPEEYIPREILKNNLYGIDIDSGATQIAALSLYVKAKEKSPDKSIPQINIISADTVLINGERKQNILSRAESKLEKQILDEIWSSFENIREYGSLVRIEKKIDDILEQYRDNLDDKDQARFNQEGSISTKEGLITSEGNKETWGQVKDRLLAQVSKISSEALDQNDPVEEMFADEVGKTVELSDALMTEYNVVITNPPYLSSREMGDSLKDFLTQYESKRNIYAAFIQRCAEFSTDDGYSITVTPETFMYQYSYRGFRPTLIDDYDIVDCLHLSNRDQEYMNVVTLLADGEFKQSHPDTRFIRLVESDNKYNQLQDTISQLQQGNELDNIYFVNQDTFIQLPNSPIIYWFGQEVLELFSNLPSIGDEADVMKGLNTGDDDRYLRCRWEVDTQQIGDKYVPISTSDEDGLFYESPNKVVEWNDKAQNEISKLEVSSIRHPEFYGNPGLTFKKFSNIFNPRIHKEGDIFGESAYFVHTGDRQTDFELLASMSSSVSRYILKGLNPGLHFNVSDVESLPVLPSSDIREQLANITNELVTIQQDRNKVREKKREFDIELFLNNCLKIDRYDMIREADVICLHGLIDDLVYDHLDISEEKIEDIRSKIPAGGSHYPHIENSGELQTTSGYIRDMIDTESISESQYSDIKSAVMENKDEPLRVISNLVEISPHSVINILHKETDEPYTLEWHKKLLSYVIGWNFGRWGDSSTDIVLFNDEMIKRSIGEILADKEISSSNVVKQMADDLDMNPGTWVNSKFFSDYHTNQYRRRGQRIPVYWQLESQEGAFNCFLYYNNIDDNTLPRLRGQYLDPRIDEYKNEIETLSAQTSDDNPDKELLNRKEEVQRDLDDLKEFRDTIDEMIDDGVTVDVEKGIWENIKEWDQYEILETGLPKLKSSYSR